MSKLKQSNKLFCRNQRAPKTTSSYFFTVTQIIFNFWIIVYTSYSEVIDPNPQETENHRGLLLTRSWWTATRILPMSSGGITPFGTGVGCLILVTFIWRWLQCRLHDLSWTHSQLLHNFQLTISVFESERHLWALPSLVPDLSHPCLHHIPPDHLTVSDDE